MVRIFIGLGVVALGLLIYCAVECIQSPKHRVRALSKPAWLAIILLLPLIGGLLWMAFGRPQRHTPPQGRSGPRAPDDDPDFLRQIQIQRRQQQRREEEARKKAEKDKNDRSASSGNRAAGADAAGAESSGPDSSATPTSSGEGDPVSETPAPERPAPGAPGTEPPAQDAVGEELDPNDPRLDALPDTGTSDEDQAGKDRTRGDQSEQDESDDNQPQQDPDRGDGQPPKKP